MRELVQQALRERGVEFEASTEEGVALRVPAKNREVGDLKLRIGEEEVVTWVGTPEIHNHLDQFSLLEEVPAEDRPRAIAEAVAAFVADMLEDRVVIEVLRKDGETRQVKTYRLRYTKVPVSAAQEGVSVQRYVWSAVRLWRGGSPTSKRWAQSAGGGLGRMEERPDVPALMTWVGNKDLV